MGARKLKLLADENIPSSVSRWLQELRRFDVITVAQANLLHAPDDLVVAYATKKKRVVLASDKGFSEHNYTVCSHAGILNVSQFNTRPTTMKARLIRVFRLARKRLSHNVVHLGEDDFCIVETGHTKKKFNYR